MNEVTLIIPYYRNCNQLARQVEEWNKYPPGVKVICVDDGSPEPALPIIEENASTDLLRHLWLLPAEQRFWLYRVLVDIPWNRGGARNLGAKMAATELIIQADIDHILPADAAAKLLEFTPNPKRWYRFPRWRVGKADDTRMKDDLPRDCEYGPVHPHGDSYMVRREVYWETGGYDEDYAGHLGGGSAFLRRLENHQEVAMLPAPIRLEVYTRNAIPDANVTTLSRDTTKGGEIRRQKAKTGNDTPRNPLRFEWKREL